MSGFNYRTAAAPSAASHTMGHYTSASRLLRSWVRNNYCALRFQEGSYAANAQNFFDAISNIGEFEGTDFAADSYKTIANINGAGYCGAIIGPALLPNTTTSFLTDFSGGHGQTTASEATGKALTFSGTAALSTTSPKFGVSSLSIGASNGYVSTPASADFNFGTGDWTVECWVKFNATTGAMALVGQTSASNNDSWLIYKDSFHNLALAQSDGSPGTLNWTWSPSSGIWYHVAVCKAAGTIRAFINGTQATLTAGSASDANSWGTSTDTLYLGREVARNNDSQLDGFLDDVRIAKGAALYTANFTPTELPPLDTCTMRLTIDGNSPETIAFNDLDLAHATYGVRPVLGGWPHVHSGESAYAEAETWRLTQNRRALSAAGTAVNYYLTDVINSLRQNEPLLRFESSLLVEMKTSAAITDTSQRRRNSAVIYKLD